MDYLFAAMGTALAFFIYKSYRLGKNLDKAKGLVIDIALGYAIVEANHKTKEIKITYKDDQ